MNCEICKAIERLGLDESAHDLWYCAAEQARNATARRTRPAMEQLLREACAFFLLQWRHQRNWAVAHYRPQLVTLGI